MKHQCLILLCITVLFSACEHKVTIALKNSMKVDRKDEVVVLNREEIAKKVDVSDEMLPVFSFNNKTIPSQVDDLDSDGKWDEVVLLFDFHAEEYIEVEVNSVPKENYPIPEQRTNIRLGIKQKDGSYKEVDSYDALSCTDSFKVIAQAESVNWENDKIAFRNYFDCRNVKDLFGKLKPAMILDKLHTPEMGNYHKLNDWGMDVLHCGSSLGSGGIALLKNDSLIRLGSTEHYRYEKIVEGSIRSIFELRYSGWDVDGEMMEATERITIYPGKYWFESDVTVSGCSEKNQIITGIVTSRLKEEPFAFETSSFYCIGTHGVQSENNDELGMAVLVPKLELGKIGRTSNTNYFKLGYQTVPEKNFSNVISETYYVGQKCTNRVAAKHYFFAAWGLEKEQWKTEDGFKRYIEEEAARLSNPIMPVK